MARRLRNVLLVVRLVVVASVVIGVPAYPTATSDRYTQIAADHGIPYRDVEIEYAPGELLVATIAGAAGAGAARALLAGLAFAGDLVAFLGLQKGWGERVALRYLALGTPLLIFIYRRVDLAVVALAVVAVVAARRRRDATGGVAMAVAILTRAWPVVVLPTLFAGRSRRAPVAALAALAVGVGAWLAIGGVDGIRQVVTYRGATGWELESTVGVVVWALIGEHRFESGANRTGEIPAWASVVSALILAVVIVAVWLRARRSPEVDPAGVPSLAAVSSLLIFAPILSPQYVSWLLPWAAVAGDDDPFWPRAAAVPIGLTAVLVTGWYLDLALGAGRDQLLLLARNASLIVLVAASFMRGDARYPEPSRGGSAAVPRERD